MFVGIDPSFTGTGVVVLDESGVVVNYTLISTDPTHTWYERVYRIDDLANSLESSLPFPCSHVVMEDYSYASSYQAHQLGELGHAYRSLLLRWYGYTIVDVVPPNTIKKFATGVGNASKEAVAGCTEAQFGYKFDDLNLSDAYAMALFSLALVVPDVFTKDQMKVVDRWRKKSSTQNSA